MSRSIESVNAAIAKHSLAFLEYYLAENGLEKSENAEEYYESFVSNVDNEDSDEEEKPKSKKAPAKKKPAKDDEEEKPKKPAKDDEEEKPKKPAKKGGATCLECGGGIRTAGEEYCAKHRKKSAAKTPAKKSAAKKSKDDKPKRARSSYLIFCSEMRATVKEEEPELTSAEIMSALGARWKALSDSKKAIWSRKAEKEKAEMSSEGAKKPAKEEEEEEEKPKKKPAKKPTKDSDEEADEEADPEEEWEEENDE